MSVKRGDVVVLKDIQTLLALMPGDSDMSQGLNLVVKCVTEVQIGDDVKYLLVETDSALSILVKSAGEHESVRVMFEPSGLPKGDREKWIEDGANWLFLPPEHEDYFASYLEYTEEIWNDAVCYRQKHGSLYGEVVFPPHQVHVYAVVHEWSAVGDVKAENPEIVVIETGVAGDPRGGFITMLQGAYVSSGDVEFISIHQE
jgi:hypothetical protein